jgi:hypothetical protein
MPQHGRVAKVLCICTVQCLTYRRGIVTLWVSSAGAGGRPETSGYERAEPVRAVVGVTSALLAQVPGNFINPVSPGRGEYVRSSAGRICRWPGATREQSGHWALESWLATAGRCDRLKVRSGISGLGCADPLEDLLGLCQPCPGVGDVAGGSVTR